MKINSIRKLNLIRIYIFFVTSQWGYSNMARVGVICKLIQRHICEKKMRAISKSENTIICADQGT